MARIFSTTAAKGEAGLLLLFCFVLCVNVRMYVCVFVCVCMYICMYVCIYMCVCVPPLPLRDLKCCFRHFVIDLEPNFLQMVEAFFQRAAAHTSHKPGFLEQIRVVDCVLAMSFPFRVRWNRAVCVVVIR